jgi:iron complex outermembrane recepter protein
MHYLRHSLHYLALFLCACAADFAWADDFDLFDMSLEELMEVPVDLTSRKAEKYFNTPAALFVLTRDDIRRSGATNLPDVLRLVPGMQVGGIDANKWAVSARGHADRFANKMLVLIDGRHVYSPLFSGVFWRAQNMVLEDVERIEVIRGPGATLWGANAVNGIINIETRAAADTQGTAISLGAGSEERGDGAISFGSRIGSGLFYRVHARYFKRDAFVDGNGIATADQTDVAHGGVRADWQPTARDRLSVNGGLFSGSAGQIYRFPTLVAPYLTGEEAESNFTGGHLIWSWNRAISPSSAMRLQGYYDKTKNRDGIADLDTDTYDLDFQHSMSLGARTEMAWGAGYRWERGDMPGDRRKLYFDPAMRTTNLYSAFVHGEVAIVPERLKLSLGSKFEHNAFSGFEYQPSIRLAWLANSRQTLWGAISRPLRTPARSDHDGRIVFRTLPAASDPIASPPVLISFAGDPSVEAEKVLVYEAGYRWHPRRSLLLDAAVFYSDYSGLRASSLSEIESRSGDDGTYLFTVAKANNEMDSRSRGGEVALDWLLPAERGRLRAAYSYLHTDFSLGPGVLAEGPNSESMVPTHQLYCWASLNVGAHIHIDPVLRYVSALRDDEHTDPATDAFFPDREVDAYWQADLRASWRPEWNRSLEFALSGRNLLAAHHREFADFFLDTLPTQTQRSVRAAVSLRY